MLLKPSHGQMRGPLGAFFRGFNRVFDRATGGYVARLAAPRTARGADDRDHRRGRRRRRPLRPRAADGVHPRGGPGDHRHQRAAPTRGVTRAHGRPAVPGRADPREDRGGRLLRDDRRVRGRHEHLPAELRQHLRAPQAVGRAKGRRPARQGHHRRPAAAAGVDPRGNRLPVQRPHHLGLRRLVGLQIPDPGPERHAHGRAARRRRPASSSRRRASGRSSATSSPPSIRTIRK